MFIILVVEKQFCMRMSLFECQVSSACQTRQLFKTIDILSYCLEWSRIILGYFKEKIDDIAHICHSQNGWSLYG